MYKTLLILLAAVALLGCKKNDDTEEKTVFPINMYAAKVDVISDTKVYVKGGLLNDPQKTKELMWIYTRNFQLEQGQENPGERYLSFIAKDSVTFFNSHSPYLIARSGNMLMMTSSIQSIAEKPLLQDQLYYYIAKHQNVKTEGNIEISKDIRVAYGSGYNELKVPMFAYVTSSWIDAPVNRLIRRGGLLVNEFNEDVIKKIGDRDTIIVKTYMLTVKAK